MVFGRGVDIVGVVADYFIGWCCVVVDGFNGVPKEGVGGFAVDIVDKILPPFFFDFD